MEYRVKGPAAWPPPHPGELVAEALAALRLGRKEAADLLGVSRQMLHKVLTGQASVTPEMAARLGKLCGNGPELWLRMQLARDLWRVQSEMAGILAAIPTMHEAA
jgi:antitoxin HigA-1